mmetsp:Transcript_14154/g.45153  ORF Transcript_14154/g.45153 Transcript_14154/m.45153 type:complete len:461 (+) Transcript_14154:358-1740(+)
MPSTHISEARLAKLAGLLEKEKQKDELNNKLKKDAAEPAKYRGCMLSSHSIVPATTAAGGRPARAQARSEGGAAARTGGKTIVREQPDAPGAPSQAGRSVRTEMEAKSKSEWALLTKFETEVYQEDLRQRKERRKQLIESQREALDSQVYEHTLQKEAAKEQKLVENQIVSKEIQKYKAEEMAMAEQARKYNDKIKSDRLRQVMEFRAKKQEEKDKKFRDDLKEIAIIKKSLVEEKRALARRKAEEKEEMEATKVENTKRITARKDKEAAQVAKDIQMAKDYIAMLERQEFERAEALKALYSRAGARAAVAGEQVVKEAKARLAAEEAMLKRMQEEKEEQLQREEREAEETRTRTLEDNMKTLEMQKKWRAEEKEAEKREMEAWVAAVKEQDAKAKQAEEDKLRIRREKNVAHRRELEIQMDHVDAHRTDNVFMSAVELKINEPLISQAVTVIGDPSDDC